MLTLHGVAAEFWANVTGEAMYLPEGFAADGFIHTSVGADVLAAALNRHYRDDPRPYVALIVELDRVGARWDVARYPPDPAAYPHIHGPLNTDAVIDVVAVPRSNDGAFLPPDIAPDVDARFG